MSDYTIKALGPDTWDAFAALAQRHNGGGFGCWCTWFHRETHAGPDAKSTCLAGEPGASAASAASGSPWCDACAYGTVSSGRTPSPRCGLPSGRVVKEQLVKEGRAHAALVFDGAVAVGWCQYGPPAELPGIHHRKDYEAALGELPDYRLTCFFVDRKYRRKGVARAALHGALELIAQAGGGVVEAYPQDLGDKKVSATFLYGGTRQLFEQAGFSYDRPKGKNHCVMTTTIQAETQLA